MRILVATDAASEGLNLHRTARYLLHYDCPWNPSRLEQRNGRLDRYGQARDVTVHHFVSDADPDLRFLGHVIRKADEIREDLGSVNEVFDRAVHRRLIQGEDESAVTTDLDRASMRPEEARTSNPMRRRPPRPRRRHATRCCSTRWRRRSISTSTPCATRWRPRWPFPTAGPSFAAAGEPGFHRVLRPDLPGWRDVIDESVRRPAPAGPGMPVSAIRPGALLSGGGANTGPMPRLAFSPEPFIERLGRLSVFQPRRDALLVHLAHPMMQRALGVLTRRRYPGRFFRGVALDGAAG